MPTTSGMKGGGYYDANSSAQRSALEAFLPWLEASIPGLVISSDCQTPIGILDVGSSEGGNAIYAMNRLISKLRSCSSQSIWVFFNDLPTNDFNHLFLNLSCDDDDLTLSHINIFPGAISGTAFDRLVPDRTLHISTTFNAIGWLEKEPDSAIPHYILPMEPGLLAPRDGVYVTESEQEPFRLQAANDLYRYYATRSQELVTGGKLLVQVFGRNNCFSTSNGIYDVLSDAILDCVEGGLLPRKVYEDLIFPIYFRTIEELSAPIQTDEHLSQAFHLEKAESREVPVPFNLVFADTGDELTWARSYCGFLRAFTETILASALPGNMSISSALDNIYGQVEQRLVSNPDRYEFHYISVGLLLTRL